MSTTGTLSECNTHPEPVPLLILKPSMRVHDARSAVINRHEQGAGR